MDKTQVEICLSQVIRECVKSRIPISSKINQEVVINKRAKKRFAACKKEPFGSPYEFKIEVGEMLLETDPTIVKNILAHEVIHTCPGCYNHGKLWKQYAAIMNQLYGYHITTTATYEQIGLKAPEKQRRIRYVITCKRCGAVFYRQRKSKLVLHTNQYRCKCGGKLICRKTEQL